MPQPQDRPGGDEAAGDVPATCVICQHEFSDAGTTWLPCAHGFCVECWSGYEDALAPRTYDANGISCPTCKLTKAEACEKRQDLELGREAAVPVTNASDVIHVDVEDEDDSASLALAAAQADVLAEAASISAGPLAEAATEPVEAASVSQRAVEEAASVSAQALGEAATGPAEAEVVTTARPTVDALMESMASKGSEIRCIHCKGVITDVKKAKLRNKTQGLFRCQLCHSKVTTLTKIGQWPPSVFSQMDEDQKASFFKTTVGTKDSLERQLRVINKQFSEQSTYYDDGGDFQPLSVLRTRGYTEDQLHNIEHNSAPEDVMEDSVMKCKIYRVKVLRVGSQGRSGHRDEENTHGEYKKERVKSRGGKFETAASDSSSSSSESSSSPANGDIKKIMAKAKRRAKRAEAKSRKTFKKAAQKAKDKQRRASTAAKKQERKERKKIKKDANHEKAAADIDAKRQKFEMKQTNASLQLAEDALKKLKPCLHQAAKAISNAEANGVDAAMPMTQNACVAKLKKLVEECTLVKLDSSKYKLSSGYTQMKDFTTEINVANKAVGMLNVMSQS